MRQGLGYLSSHCHSNEVASASLREGRCARRMSRAVTLHKAKRARAPYSNDTMVLLVKYFCRIHVSNLDLQSVPNHSQSTLGSKIRAVILGSVQVQVGVCKNHRQQLWWFRGYPFERSNKRCQRARHGFIAEYTLNYIRGSYTFIKVHIALSTPIGLSGCRGPSCRIGR